MNEPLETDEQGNKPVNPEYCRRCGFKGTPLCTHPTGYYQPEPKGLNKLFSDLESNTILSKPGRMSEPNEVRNPWDRSEP